MSDESNPTNKNEVLTYFKGKAQGYDLVDQQVYWVLSDKLLWSVFDDLVLSKKKGSFVFLDAGGGTGRWSEKILRAYPLSAGLIYDLSSEMLQQAELKRKNGLEKRLTLMKGDIQDMNLPDNNFDISFNFHNVLGFVDSPKKALKEITRVTKKGGLVVSVIPNRYHCMFFNLAQGRIEEAEHIGTKGSGRFTSDMPYMHLFTPCSIGSLYSSAGLKTQQVLGFPVTIYPGFQETQITGSSKSIANILENEANFKRIYQLEKKLVINPDCAARGNNLITIGEK